MQINFKPQILIVEDEDRWHEIYGDLLSQKYSLTSVKTLQRAESVLSIVKFDVAIIDLGLDRDDPLNTDGIKIIKKINTFDPTIRIIVVTANTDKIHGSDPQIKGFIDTVIEKGESLVKDLPNIIENAIRVKTAKRKWAYLGDPESRKSGYESFKELLSSLLKITKADVVHMLIPNDQDQLEIIVDTGQDEGRIVKINESVTGKCFRTKNAINLGDCQSDLEYQPPQNPLEMNSELAVPVEQGNEIIGVLNIESQNRDAFENWHQDLMNIFAHLAVSILQEDRRQIDWKLLNDIAQELLKPTTNINQTLKNTLGQALSLFDAQMAFLGRKEGGNFIVEIATLDTINQRALNTEETIIKDALKSELPKRVIITSIVNPSYLNFENLSEMVIPFRIDGAIWLLSFGRNKPYMFTPEHEKNASFLVSQISSAISTDNQSRLLIELKGQQKQSALAAQLVHSVGNPIRNMRDWFRSIQTDIESLRDKYPNITNALFEIEENIDQLMKVVAQVKQKLRQSSQKTTSINVNQCILTVLEEIQISEKNKNVQINIQLEEQLPEVFADERLKNVFFELIQNSLDAINNSGEIRIRTTKEGTDVTTIISDTGPGISPKAHPFIFDMGYTTKKKRTNADGLGLYSSKVYIDSCQGSIIEIGEFGKGAIFVITLPSSKV